MHTVETILHVLVLFFRGYSDNWSDSLSRCWTVAASAASHQTPVPRVHTPHSTMDRVAGVCVYVCLLAFSLCSEHIPGRPG